MKSSLVIVLALMLISAVGLTGCAPVGVQPAVEMVSIPVRSDAPSPIAADQALSQPTGDRLTIWPQFASIAPLSTQARDDRATLAEDVANPISNLTSLPLRFTYQKGLGPKDSYTTGLLAQPVIPISLNKDWYLVTQTNVPITYVGSVANGIDSESGLGDTLQNFYIVPEEPGRRGWIFGLGPAFQYPTATNDKLGTGKWCAGPTGALVRQYQGWTYGGIVDQIWSFAGDDDRRDVSVALVHPLVTYTWQTGTSLTVDSNSSYDWVAHQWTIPVQLAVSQVVVRGRRPVQLTLAGLYYTEGPVGGPEWGIRFSITILFPK